MKRLFILILLVVGMNLMGINAAFSASFTITSFSDWGIFGTDDHFEVKDGGTSDWDLATKSGSNVLSSINLGNFTSGTTYNYTLAYNSGTLTLTVDDPDGGTGSKSFSFTSTAGFEDIWIMAKSSSGSSVSDVTYNEFGGGALSASASKDGVHISADSGYFSGTLLSGTFTFTNSQSNSDTEMFIGVQNSAVPIPGAAWLLGSGLIGLVGFRRKFRKKA